MGVVEWLKPGRSAAWTVVLSAALLLAWGAIAQTPAHADDVTLMSISVSGSGVSCSADVCTVDPGSTFTATVAVDDAPDGGYILVQSFINYGTSLTYNRTEDRTDELLWPDVASEQVFVRGEVAAGLVNHGGLTGLIPPLPASEYVGPVFEIYPEAARGVAGTALLPTFSFIADPNTGVFNPAADLLGLSAGGVELLRVDKSTNRIRFNEWGHLTGSILTARADTQFKFILANFTSILGQTHLWKVNGNSLGTGVEFECNGTYNANQDIGSLKVTRTIAAAGFSEDGAVFELTRDVTGASNGGGDGSSVFQRFLNGGAEVYSVDKTGKIIASGLGIGTTPDELAHFAKAVDGEFTGLLIENSQPADAGTNETAEIRFGFGGNNDVARIRIEKKADYQSAANEDSAMRFFIDINGVATRVVSVLNSGLSLSVPASKVDFMGTAGGGGQGVRYKDAGGSTRNALMFPGSDIVALSNQATDGTVEIRANTSTAGSSGEKTIAVFEDDKIRTLMGASTGRSTVGGVADSQFIDVGNVGLGEDVLQTFTLPANALNANGKAIRIRAIFRTAENANVKTIKHHFGGTVIGQSGAAALNNRTIYFDVIVVRTGASAHRSTAMRIEGVDGLLADNTQILRKFPTDDTTAAIVIKGTGQTTTDVNDDVIQESMLVEFLN